MISPTSPVNASAAYAQVQGQNDKANKKEVHEKAHAVKPPKMPQKPILTLDNNAKAKAVKRDTEHRDRDSDSKKVAAKDDHESAKAAKNASKNGKGRHIDVKA